MEKEKRKVGKGEMEKNLAGAVKNLNCNDKNCHIHGNLKTRGRNFEGRIIKKFSKRVTIEFERMTYVRKYERYKKSRTKIHARLPICMEDKVKIGDLIKIQECRPLSKIIHFAVIEKIKDKKEK
jgi:small subunit ribosomal protein S17|tara:strand:- start:123 stop:494 length:372 start_codon:yes stop_codon:yes gene_type:complete